MVSRPRVETSQDEVRQFNPLGGEKEKCKSRSSSSTTDVDRRDPVESPEEDEKVNRISEKFVKDYNFKRRRNLPGTDYVNIR